MVSKQSIVEIDLLSKQFKYTYQSKCVDRKSAMFKFHRLQHYLLNEDALKILHLHASKMISADNNIVKLSISVQFELNIYAKKLMQIADRFDAFTVYLDSISQI